MNKIEIIKKWREEMEYCFRERKKEKNNIKRSFYALREKTISEILKDLEQLNSVPQAEAPSVDDNEGKRKSCHKYLDTGSDICGRNQNHDGCRYNY